MTINESVKKTGLWEELPEVKNRFPEWAWTNNLQTSPEIYTDKEAWPKITIVTPSYNQGQYIETTIRSVLLQNYPNLEYIIIDGGSTDNTVEVIKKYEKWISYWVSEKDDGQSDAINKGLKKSTGTIFNWLNSDDFLEKGALELIARTFTDKKADIVAGKMRKFVDGYYKIDIGASSPIPSAEEGMNWFSGQPSIFIRTSPYDIVGNINKTLNYRMDIEWHIRYPFIFGTKNIHYVTDIISYSNLHNECKTASQALGFNIEMNTILWNIAKELNLNDCLIIKHAEKLEFNKEYENRIVFKIVIDKKKMQSLIDKKIGKELEDNSVVFRNAAYNLLYQGVVEQSFVLAWKALKTRPFLLINWRCLFYSLRENIRRKSTKKQKKLNEI
jgi:glycosyltransferase involved in cell wall biosynthesis